MTSAPSAVTWGSPTAAKQALLIHGLTSSAQTWHRVATLLAAQGYFVTAPNLIGHGFRVSKDYSVTSMARDLYPYLEARNYSLIIGHSLGALTVLSLTASIPSSNPTAIILVDPPLQVNQEGILSYDNFFTNATAEPKPADAYAVENSLWTREDCISREFGTRMCAADAVHQIFEQNTPWHFLDCLNAISRGWKVTTLIADPAIYAVCCVEDLRPYQIRSVIASGCGHWIQNDSPDIVVEEALKTVAELETD